MPSPAATVLLIVLAAAPLSRDGANPIQAARAPAARTQAQAAQLESASTALDAGEPERALKLLAPVLKQRPADVRARILAARAHIARDEYGPAHDHLRRALAADARNIDALYYIGIVAGELAARELNRVYELSPDGARAHQLTAESLVLQQKPAEAAAAYEQALRAAPDLFDALIGLAELRREQADCAAAIALYERAQDATRTSGAAYGLGMCFAVQSDHARAAEQFRTAIAQDPSSAASHFALGSSLLQLGETAGAVTALERAVALDPKLRQGHYLLGRAYRVLGKEDLSRRAFARADDLMRAEQARDEKALGVQPGRIIRD